MFLSWAGSALIVYSLLPWLRRLRLGQRIRSQGPQSHLKKAGTPTLGGLGFTPVWLLVSAVSGALSAEVMLVILVAAVYALLGFADDYLKIIRRSSLGLPARYKIFVEIILGVAASFVAANVLGRGSTLTLYPSALTLDLKGVYVLFGTLVIIGTANAVNLTDGLDGLAAGTAGLAFLSYATLFALTGRVEMAVMASSAVGALAGFLPYNVHPAEVFMGDTGALALGGALGAMAVVTGTEMRLLLIGGVFVVETISVILQVSWFRLTGNRVFLMSPLHHHFELAGWSEVKVVRVFWLAAALCGALGLLGPWGVVGQ